MTVKVTMSEAERAKLMLLEQQTGLSPSALLVDGVFSDADPVAVQVRREQLSELIQLRRYMATIANNVNQLTRYAHTHDGQFSAETAATVREAREFGARTLSVIEELTP